MAMEPFTIFARIADPAAVAGRLRELMPSVEIDGPDENWRTAVASFEIAGQTQTLTLTHDPEYYAEPNWSTQMSGMRCFFARFPETDRKSIAMTLTTSLRFSLGTLFEPDFDPGGDPRLDIVFDVTRLLDGVLFTPSSLRDARGRVLFSADGEEEEDPDAQWPRVVGEVDISDPLGAEMHELSRPKQATDDDAAEEAPTADRVARRALALTAVTARAVLEREAAEPHAAGIYRDLHEWLNGLRIDDELEPEEWEVLQRPLGRLEMQSQINSTWRLEGLVVLAWSLGCYEIPPHDELVDMNPLWARLGFLDDDAAQALITDATLRSRDELRVLRNRLFSLHWRLRNFHLDAEVLNFAEIARNCWFGPLDVTNVPLVQGDLSLQGERIDRAPPELFSTAHSAAQERHQAANWIWQGPACYSSASVAT